MPKLEIEIFSAPRCGQCANAQKLAQKVIDELKTHPIELRIVDIVEEQDYAIRLRLRGAPAIAIDGELVFPAIPTEAELKQAILIRLERT